MVEHETSEGLFRFGRALDDKEETAYSAPFVERHLTRALEELARQLEGEMERAVHASAVTAAVSSDNPS